MFGWGIGVIFHAWDVLRPEPGESVVQTAMNLIARRR
ncbi:hypothetical protein [Kribbella sp. NBC_00889]